MGKISCSLLMPFVIACSWRPQPCCCSRFSLPVAELLAIRNLTDRRDSWGAERLTRSFLGLTPCTIMTQKNNLNFIRVSTCFLWALENLRLFGRPKRWWWHTEAVDQQCHTTNRREDAAGDVQSSIRNHPVSWQIRFAQKRTCNH